MFFRWFSAVDVLFSGYSSLFSAVDALFSGYSSLFSADADDGDKAREELLEQMKAYKPSSVCVQASLF